MEHATSSLLLIDNKTFLSFEIFLSTSDSHLEAMSKRSLTFAMKAVWLLFHFISQTIASQASDVRSDGFALVDFAKAIPGLQNLAGTFLPQPLHYFAHHSS